MSTNLRSSFSNDSPKIASSCCMNLKYSAILTQSVSDHREILLKGESSKWPPRQKENCKGSWEKMSFNYLFMIIDFTHDLTHKEIHACRMMVVTRISVEINSS